MRAVWDAWEHRENPDDGVLWQALRRNTGSVARFVPQLLDVFLAAIAVLAALSLLAFTRGDRLEKFLRPSIFTMYGFMLGAVVALAVVAIGFGGQVRPRSYFGEIADTDIHDGDTFWIGEMPMRLWGVDAPELNQICRGANDCGDTAREDLARLVSGALVRCDQEMSSGGRIVESFGRPLVRCEVRRGEEAPFDLGEQMISSGRAARYKNDAAYYPDVQERFALGCTLRPHVWRSRRPADVEARAAFERDGTIVDPTLAMGACT